MPSKLRGFPCRSQEVRAADCCGAWLQPKEVQSESWFKNSLLSTRSHDMSIPTTCPQDVSLFSAFKNMKGAGQSGLLYFINIRIQSLKTINPNTTPTVSATASSQSPNLNPPQYCNTSMATPCKQSSAANRYLETSG